MIGLRTALFKSGGGDPVIMLNKVFDMIRDALADDYKMAIVVRNDLKMSKGKIAGQVAHAAVLCALEAYRRYKDSPASSSDNLYARWMMGGMQKKVVVKVDSLDELITLKQKADEAGLINALITDAGLTQLDPHTVTVLGIGPDKGEKIDAITGHLKLV